MAPCRAATSFSTSRAARHCSWPPTSVTVTSAPILAILPPYLRSYYARVISSAPSTSRVTSHSLQIFAFIRDRRHTPRLAFGDAAIAPRVLKQEEPFPCIRCGKPFGVKSTIERVTAKLEGKHWMYQNSRSRLDVIKMCEDCRVAVVTEEGFDPYGAPARPKPRTTDDYLRERERKPES